MREKVILVCEICLSRNYTTKKNKLNTTTRMEIKKFCPRCNKHTVHKETKKRRKYKMAVQKEEKKNRVLQAISHEWKYENLILVCLALFALELGVLLLTGDLDFAQNVFLLSDYKTVFAWILVGLGVIALLLAVASFYRPSLAEVKHVTGLKRKEFFVNVITVFVFILVIAGLIFAYESVITLIENAFK